MLRTLGFAGLLGFAALSAQANSLPSNEQPLEVSPLPLDLPKPWEMMPSPDGPTVQAAPDGSARPMPEVEPHDVHMEHGPEIDYDHTPVPGVRDRAEDMIDPPEMPELPETAD